MKLTQWVPEKAAPSVLSKDIIDEYCEDWIRDNYSTFHKHGWWGSDDENDLRAYAYKLSEELAKLLHKRGYHTSHDEELACELATKHNWTYKQAKAIEKSKFCESYYSYVYKLRREWVKENNYTPPFKDGEPVLLNEEEYFVIYDNNYPIEQGNEGYVYLTSQDTDESIAIEWENVSVITD